MNAKNMSCAAIAATLMMSCGQIAVGGTDKTGKGGKMDGPTERDAKVLAGVSYVSTVATTNYMSLASYMTPDAKEDFLDFCEKMKFDGKQYFMPDFCKLKYVAVGGLDESGYVAGLYNPF